MPITFPNPKKKSSQKILPFLKKEKEYYDRIIP
jgi:hypothetical protein